MANKKVENSIEVDAQSNAEASDSEIVLTVYELTTKEEMLAVLPVLNYLYPNLDEETYSSELDEMIACRYGQVAVFENEQCIAVSGFWRGNKLWCGKYIELDNIVVNPNYRSRGAGKLMIDFLVKKAEELGCTMLSLDSYTTNFKAHKLFYNEGFGPMGFHFIRLLQAEKVRG
ncbi:MAG: hypothetical protein RL264_564 [Bacteroidota bacterium]|jgi:GNAT superfamily N-acetyltransferase